MKILPLFDQVFIKPMTEEKETTESGIALPKSSKKEKVAKGKVIAVGSGEIGNDGSIMLSPLSVSDIVLYNPFGAYEVEDKGERYILIAQKHIVAIVK
jgi:chaperonin GroES